MLKDYQVFISEESRDKVTFTAPNWSLRPEGNSVSISYDLPLPGLYLVIYNILQNEQHAEKR